MRRSGRVVILGIETSCDDTCAAVVDGAEIRSNLISSQAAAHEQFGGIVPEVASRHHLELVNPIVDAALVEAEVELADLDAVEPVERLLGRVGAPRGHDDARAGADERARGLEPEAAVAAGDDREAAAEIDALEHLGRGAAVAKA